MAARKLEIRNGLEKAYADVFTPEAVAALEALASLDADRKAVMAARIERRATRARNQQRIAFLDPQATMRFAMTLSEVCQNIVEHAGLRGWVAVQTYRYRQRLGRRVVVIAVCDAGIGFRRSLESAQGRKRVDRWDDATALEDAVVRGVSRFRDPGRGQGLAGNGEPCAR